MQSYIEINQISYSDALDKLGLQTLGVRQQTLSQKFVVNKCLKYSKSNEMKTEMLTSTK